MDDRPALLYVTDLTYPARGRRYGDEDVHLSVRLRPAFRVSLCHPVDAPRLMSGYDGVVVRNSGPVLGYLEQYEEFRAAALARGVPVFNQLTGRADQLGKQYLIDLSNDGYPVIPTAPGTAGLSGLPLAEQYVIKPLQGADSAGLEIVRAEEVTGRLRPGTLVQPRLEFAYEVSFYFLGHDFQYALYTPDQSRRWQLRPYSPTAADLAFAQRFVDWNTVEHGIQRVDAALTADGDLLLVELEDLNPYLSLDALDAVSREAFVSGFIAALGRLLA